ncbi:MAG TPA: tRNA pseudouridine(38-40) synthase TruA [Methylomirabilota bacterium]|nr:tRNA pseudouridine(38-40) synthase TruA [Methylomirabilota bacterium]
MRTLRLVIQYDGREFSGWQRQSNQLTVQGVLTESLTRVLQEPVRVIGASRTDAGVHALGQVASVTTASALPLRSIRAGLNSLLPPTVRVPTVEEAAEGFDARRWARAKRYFYLIDNNATGSPLFRHVSWHVNQPLDRGQMARALSFLRGQHDFSAFCAAPGRGRSPICRIHSLHLRSRRQFVGLFFSADSFLHHMVRNIVGSVVEIGKGRRAPEWIGELLLNKDRTLAGPTAPAHGLVLLRVLYPRGPGTRVTVRGLADSR